MAKKVPGDMGWFLEYYLGEYEERKRRTKDFPYLRKKEIKEQPIYLFVYGSLRKNFPLADRLKRERFVSHAISYSGRYQLFNLGSFPALIETYQGEEAVDPEQEQGYIYGEIYDVSPDTLHEIDNLEANGSLYNRWTRRFYPILLTQATSCQINQEDIRGHDLLRGVKIDDTLECYVYLADLGASLNQIIKNKKIPAMAPRPNGTLYWEDGYADSVMNGLIPIEKEEEK